MAAAQQPKDPLDALQHTFNECLVNTGKALKASHKNGPRSVSSTAGAINVKMRDTMKAYHHALDDLESEITRAKAVLLRDLERLQAARMPISEPEPSPQPVAPPAPMMEDVKQPAAVMLEMPSTAAHTVNPNMGFEIKEETKRVAPFPDMGMGLAADVVDLTSGGDVKPPMPTVSPHVPPAAMKAAGPMGAGARASPSIKQSPKPTPPMGKATPVPPPSAAGAKAAPATQQQPPAPAPAPQAAPDHSMDTMPTTGGAAMADMTSGELNFTNMEFTLAPTPGDGPSQNAPPAPMQDFDLSSFANSTPQNGGGGGGGNDLLVLDNFGSAAGPPPPEANNAGAVAPAPAAPQNTAPPATAPAPAQPTTTIGGDNNAADSSANIDSLFDLDSAGGDNMDLDLNLGDGSGMGGMGENSFNDLFMPDGDMDQFDDQYFQLE
ncbi:hypothetical protein PG993_006362 [Apiospora rasikravindrae]|uniref:Uncharacterized protein n=1 Tax=Apiospora rasikravindrae TaxID=990691 RepID=A0ABR1T7L5_9PEZI